MTEVPKVVYDRLRATPYQAAHSEADMLTAFIEQSLAPVERTSVLEHLAYCGECRELVMLSLPAMEIELAGSTIGAAAEATVVSTKRPRVPANAGMLKQAWLRFVSPTVSGYGFRWAAVAAMIAVIASVLVIHPGKVNQSTASSKNAPVIAATAPTNPALSPPSSNATSTSEMQLSKSLKNQDVTPSKRTAVAEHVPNETVATLPKTNSDASSEPMLMARNDAPAIEKAKPALQEFDTQRTQSMAQDSSGAPASAPSAFQNNRISAAKQLPAASSLAVQQGTRWTISEGVLQRSIDNGQTWQESLRPTHPLLCYAMNGKEIWTGGRTGTLFHSYDGGITWTPVEISADSEHLISDITHIDLQPTAKIIVTSGNNEEWNSFDGGQTWRKK